MDRRTFLWTAASLSRVAGANDRIRMGLIGCGGRGRYVARCIRDVGGVEFVAVSDVSRNTAAQAQEWAGAESRVYPDFRRLLERKDFDAVLVGTPDHWHAIPTVLACEAGKDVYVEKPLGHSIVEGRAMINAARRHKRIVCTGTQQRSATHFPEVAKIIQGGQLGKVHYVRVWNFTNMLPNGFGRKPDGPVPDGVDWNMYLGPAPKVPFNPLRFQRTYRWFWDYAGGTITDYGTHRFDTVHQIMGAEIPRAVSASGGRFALQDGGEMPDILQVTYEYPGWVLSYEASNISAHGLGGRTSAMKYYNMRGTDDRPHGMAFYGTNGALFCDRIGYEIYPDNDKVQRIHRNTADATPLHAAHFVECLRSRKTPRSDVETGHRATIIAHLGNIAYKTGKKLQWNGQREEFAGAADANRLLYREPRKPWDILRKS